MIIRTSRKRILDPLDRFSEIVFGLIMVLSFTCAMSVAHAGHEEVRTMFIGAISCNLAWGIIDAAFYIIACLTEHGRHVFLLRSVQQTTDPEQAQRMITETLPPKVAEVLRPADFERIQAHLKLVAAPTKHSGLTGENWRGAFGVFLLVFVSTFPVVVPFLFLHDARVALHISNGIAVGLLFGAGHMLAGYAGLRPFRTGISMVVLGAFLVALTIALGG